MAARRLIVVMLVLLVLSSVAAALVQVEPRAGERSQGSSPTTAESQPSTTEPVQRRIDAGGRKRTIRLALGEMLVLIVTSKGFDRVEIAALGELENVDPADPARFDLLPADPGVYPVRLLDARRTIARIEVRANASS